MIFDDITNSKASKQQKHENFFALVKSKNYNAFALFFMLRKLERVQPHIFDNTGEKHIDTPLYGYLPDSVGCEALMSPLGEQTEFSEIFFTFF